MLRAEFILKPAKKKLEEAGYKVKTKVCFGRATENIVKVSKEIKPDLIIMDRTGRTPVKGLLFGSKTSSVLASTKAPMLVLRKESQYAEDRMRKLEFALTDLNTAMPQLNMPSNICSYSAKILSFISSMSLRLIAD